MSQISDSSAALRISRDDAASGLRVAVGFAAFLHAAWLVAWLLEQYLETRTGILPSHESRFVYWTIAKLMLWVLPAIAVIHLSGRTVRDTLAFERFRAILAWGAGAGILLGATAVIPKILNHQSLVPIPPD